MTGRLRGVVPGALLAIGFAATPAGEDAPSIEEQVKDFESRIAELGRLDRDHPEALQVRLDYANVLAGFASADCAWLQKSQAQLDSVAASPVTRLLLSDGEARLAAIEYRILSHRARCTEDAAQATQLARASLDRARAAQAAYEQAYDYLNAAIMQFNVAAEHRRLEETAQSIVELEKAIELGKTYGLRADVEENYGYLQEWQGEEADAAAVSKLMERWPLRKASFKFAWQPGTFKQHLDAKSARLTGGKAIGMSFTATGTMTLARKGREWTVAQAYEVKDMQFDAGNDEMTRKLAGLMTRLLANLPTTTITREGEFKEMPGLAAWSARVETEARALLRSLLPANDPRLQKVDAIYDETIGPRAKPDVVLAHSREGFNLDVAMWTDATLEHGQAYEMTSALRMPGTPQGQLDHKLEFTVTRWLPCTSGETVARCVEVVLHGVPDETAVASTVENLGKSRPEQAPWQYWAHTLVRLVTDPSTLTPYASEVRRYSYIGAAGAKERMTQIESERHSTSTIPD